MPTRLLDVTHSDIVCMHVTIAVHSKFQRLFKYSLHQLFNGTIKNCVRPNRKWEIPMATFEPSDWKNASLIAFTLVSVHRNIDLTIEKTRFHLVQKLKL